MTASVTLLIASGRADPTWTLTPEQEEVFIQMLEASPVPSVAVDAPSPRPGYGGIMVRNGEGERWVAYRGWIRGGVVSRVDDQRILERWLLETGRSTTDPQLMAALTQFIAQSE